MSDKFKEHEGSIISVQNVEKIIFINTELLMEKN
ncbi:MAG: hypothetical protein CM15mP93_13390 [Thiotrichaceae bacterium]|nr:MAG: hypothetical protein CM15mP93_13390 [Thiotrichaceae bacterium]